MPFLLDKFNSVVVLVALNFITIYLLSCELISVPNYLVSITLDSISFGICREVCLAGSYFRLVLVGKYLQQRRW